VIPDRLQPIISETTELARLFEAAGYHIYLVGGTVRTAIDARRQRALDLLDGADIDLTTDALPDEIEALLVGWADATWLQGKRFGTIGARRQGRRFEITTHRAEVYAVDSRKPEVRFGTDIVEDLSRRDFTINAMAIRLPEPELLDPFDGIVDLAAGRLRTPLDPAVSFGDDPLRMLRAARFIAGLGLAPEPSLTAAVVSMSDRLAIVSAERIRDELDKLLVVEKPSPGLWFLVRTGLAGRFLPELPALELEQDPVHRHKDVLAHTIAVVDKCSPDRLLRLAALLHDIGKPRTRAFGPEGVSFHHHDVVGARMARERLSALHYSNEDIETVSKLVELHLRFHTYSMGWTDSAVRRYRHDAGELLDRLNELTRCDCTTRSEAKARDLARRMDELETRLADLAEREALDSMRPELDGLAVMRILGVPPGPAVGRALSYLLEIRLNDGLIGEEAARSRLIEWWKRQQPETA
jgi:poly(A) polymerase